ncbi:MAG: hypothetical protein Q8K59_12125 [Nitrosomonas sp.]|nr:hypothetical protein [Nitrosomonas sp.]MDP1951811.1 hypothetical protein [Nitrosomonas sp.]
MVTKRGKQASRKAAARKYGFLEMPISLGMIGSYIFYIVLQERNDHFENCDCRKRRADGPHLIGSRYTSAGYGISYRAGADG